MFFYTCVTFLRICWLWLELKFIFRLEACLGLTYFEPQPSENVRVGKACNLQAVKLKISHCIVLITKRWIIEWHRCEVVLRINLKSRKTDMATHDFCFSEKSEMQTLLLSERSRACKVTFCGWYDFVLNQFFATWLLICCKA